MQISMMQRVWMILICEMKLVADAVGDHKATQHASSSHKFTSAGNMFLHPDEVESSSATQSHSKDICNLYELTFRHLFVRISQQGNNYSLDRNKFTARIE